MTKYEYNDRMAEGMQEDRIKDLEVALQETTDFMTTLYNNVQYMDMGYDELDFISKNYQGYFDFNTSLLKED